MCTGMKLNQPLFSSSSGGGAGAVAVAVGFDAVIHFCTCAGVAPGITLVVAKKVNQLL